MADPVPSLIIGGPLHVEKAVYGGDGLARTASGDVVFVPFALPGETVQGDSQLTVLQVSPERVEPRCVHFGACGGCQYQMANYPAQLDIKEAILRETLERAGMTDLPAMQRWGSPDPWGYRNRIRLRARDLEGTLRLGYNVRGTKNFLPIRMCPIAAPILWHTAEVLMQAAAENIDAKDWLRAASEVELFCDEAARQVQVHLLCPGAVPFRKGSFDRFAQRLRQAEAAVVSLGASRLHVPSGRALESIESWGADGLSYRVGEGRFWLRRGSFFQINRFLLPRMVEIVCAGRSGELAWDLFAGAGLFARALARRFDRVTAVEANPLAQDELNRGLRPGRDQAVAETALAFLQKAVVQRERPEVIVLDPPRAGTGEEACRLLARLAPREIVYVSCDPTTLARDLRILTAEGYGVAEMHMIDLFPQTYHLETVMVLQRTDM